MAPSLVDFLATECREILDILLDMVVFPSSKYFDTKNRVFNCNLIHLQFKLPAPTTHNIYYIILFNLTYEC
jgi:hypothetical protein